MTRILLLCLLLAGDACAQCGPGGCTVPMPTAPSSYGPSAHVRVAHYAKGMMSYGSGTIVEDDGKNAIVLSVAHLFADGPGQTCVMGKWGKSNATETTIDRDRRDISAIVIPSPGVPIVSVAEPSGDTVTLCGYGNGTYRRVSGSVREQTETEIIATLTAREGDSGGAILDSQGRLVGVCWGTGGGETRATCCRPIRSFLARVRARFGIVRRQPNQPKQPWIASPTQPPPINPEIEALKEQLQALLDQALADKPAPEPVDVDAIIQAAAAEAARVASEAVNTTPAPIPDSLPVLPTLPAEPVDATDGDSDTTGSALPTIAGTALSSLSPLALAALGIGTGGTGTLAVLGAKMALSALWRRRKRRKQEIVRVMGDMPEPREEAGQAAEPFSEAEPESTSWPRETGEAEQFLQLSHREGRAPLLDALFGRLADDDLANTIDGSTNQPERDFAVRLKERLDRRFNEMAPLAIVPDKES